MDLRADSNATTMAGRAGARCGVGAGDCAAPATDESMHEIEQIASV
jgi:hypothetical protein